MYQALLAQLQQNAQIFKENRILIIMGQQNKTDLIHFGDANIEYENLKFKFIWCGSVGTLYLTKDRDTFS